MATKLDWSYHDQSGEYRATLGDLRIRAVHDDDARNPFEEDDGNWPISVRLPDRYRSDFRDYDKVPGAPPRDPLSRFKDAALVHNQVHIAKALGAAGVKELLDEASSWDADDGPVPNYCHDAGILRDAFDNWLSNTVEASDMLDVCVELYKLLDIPALAGQVHGHSQGDWAQVMVVATPEAQEKFGCKEVTEADLEATIQLYEDWAYGNVFGYIVERAVPAPAENDETGHCTECGRDNTGHEGEPCLYEGGNGEDCPMYADGENVEWEEIPDGSCWGFFGDDFDKYGLDKSGLDEQAFDAASSHLKAEDTPCPVNRRPQSTCPDGCTHGA